MYILIEGTVGNMYGSWDSMINTLGVDHTRRLILVPSISICLCLPWKLCFLSCYTCVYTNRKFLTWILPSSWNDAEETNMRRKGRQQEEIREFGKRRQNVRLHNSLPSCNAITHSRLAGLESSTSVLGCTKSTNKKLEEYLSHYTHCKRQLLVKLGKNQKC